MSRPLYLPLDVGIFESSLMDESVETRWLFLTMIGLGQRPGADGEIDMPVSALAAAARMSEERVRESLAVLLTPDPNSRNPDHGGQRLLLLDPARPNRGWKLVTYEAHKDLVHRANDAARKRDERAAVAEAAGREPGKPGRPPKSGPEAAKPGGTRRNPAEHGGTRRETAGMALRGRGRRTRTKRTPQPPFRGPRKRDIQKFDRGLGAGVSAEAYREKFRERFGVDPNEPPPASGTGGDGADHPARAGTDESEAAS